jgi:Ca2+-binding RTX toxin-like protein
MRALAGITTVVGLAIAAVAPAAASAVEIRTEQVQIGVLIVEANQSFANQLGVSWVVSPSGAPDLVIGDTRAGIPDPIPAPCARVDAMIARCPARAFTRLQVDLGAGDDLVVVARPTISEVDGFIRMELSLGTGNDRATDLSNTRDVWNGGSGRDRMSSGPLNDIVSGGPQNDLINCGAGPHDLGKGGPGRLDLSRNCETVKH